jgi:acyl-lipid omega-6 desaturase (Delta-12 desaturase)
MATNLVVVVAATALIRFIGVGPFLLVHLPIALLASSVGVWLFYVQHQFEGTFWAHGGEWNFHEASLRGSSYYDLPGILRWFTANIGVHHVHHLCSRIPYYRLPQTLRDNPDLRSVSRITLFQSFRCVQLVLWDESCRRLVSFRDARSKYPPAEPGALSLVPLEAACRAAKFHRRDRFEDLQENVQQSVQRFVQHGPLLGLQVI